jgi:hypothetical protein
MKQRAGDNEILDVLGVVNAADLVQVLDPLSSNCAAADRDLQIPHLGCCIANMH